MPALESRWTIADLLREYPEQPRHELLDGVLLVSAMPSLRHQRIAQRLSALLHAFVTEHQLGEVVAPGEVRVGDDTLLEPDLMVLPAGVGDAAEWDSVPAPLLVVEIVSPSSRRFDYVMKRESYLRSGVAEYWIVDAERGVVVRVRAGREDEEVRTRFSWTVGGAAVEVDVQSLVVSR